MSSPCRTGDRGNFHTPTRTRVRAYDAAGLSQTQIKRKMLETHNVTISQPTISRLLASNQSRRTITRLGRPRLISNRTARYLARLATRGWGSRRMIYKQIAQSIGLDVSVKTVQRALKKLGYRRCVACSRPFITSAQAKKRVAFAIKHLYWTINNWARVIWSDEASFETGKRGRVFITRRAEERYH